MDFRRAGTIMKILFVAPAGTAGTLQYTHSLANALAKLGHQVTLATGVDFEMKPYPREYHLVEVFDRYRLRPLLMLRFLRLLRTFHPEIIHFQGAQHPEIYLGLYGILRMLTRARFVYTPQDVLPNKLRGYHKPALRFLYKRMCYVFLNTGQNEQQVVKFFRVDPKQISVLPIADYTDFIRDSVAPEYPNVADDRKVVLCFGLIEPRKGILTLIKAFPHVRTEVPEAHLLIVGRPHVDLGTYWNEIERLSLRDSVELIPKYVSFGEMAGFFNRADVVVLPYETGWNSGVLASAFGFGKPVVATEVAGFPEVVEEGKTGFLVPPRDPDSLADALIRVLKDDALREKMAGGARKASQKYAWSEIAKKTEDIYVSVLSTGAGDTP